MAFLRWIAGFAIALAALLFAVSNLHSVEIFMSPVHGSFTLPLYIIGLGLMGVGFLLGSVMMWVNMGGLRAERRRQKKHIKALEHQIQTSEEAS